jgi:hypothetical protein
MKGMKKSLHHEGHEEPHRRGLTLIPPADARREACLSEGVCFGDSLSFVPCSENPGSTYQASEMERMGIIGSDHRHADERHGTAGRHAPKKAAKCAPGIQ